MLAYIICGYFFAQFANTIGGTVAKAAVTAIIFVVFGLLVFYATRVGEGKAIKRFSLVTLIVLDLPALLILIAFIFEPVPLHAQITGAPIVAYMAAIALGYGIPYTFLSGFETVPEEVEEEEEKDEEENEDEAPAVLEGGVEADLEQEEEAPAEEEPVDEVVVEGEAADENETAEEKEEATEE